jgi:hypothetical protein
MMKRLAFALAAAAALALPASVAAKEISALQLCGAGGCRTITDHNALARFEQAGGDSDRSVGPAAPTPFYLLKVVVNTGEGGDAIAWQTYYVPAGRVFRGVQGNHAEWTRAPEAARTVLDQAADGLEPYTVPVVSRATVGRKVAKNPASYLALFQLPARKARLGVRTDWVRIRLRSAVPSPWTDGKNVLYFSARGRVLLRDGETVRLPKRVARSVRRASAVRLPSRRPAAPAPATAVPAAMLGALTMLGFGLRRRSGR